MELTLTADIEIVLKEQASQIGTTPEQLALHALRQLFVHKTEQLGGPPATLAEFLRGYIGVIHSSEHVGGGAQLSKNTGAQFAQLMVQKRNEGHL